jgi:hypothetical protein
MDDGNNPLSGLHQWIEDVVKRVAREEFARRAQAAPPGSSGDERAEEIRAELARINAKEFITAREAATLLSCSVRHMHNLVDRTRRDVADNPIPYRKVGDTTVFRRPI